MGRTGWIVVGGILISSGLGMIAQDEFLAHQCCSRAYADVFIGYVGLGTFVLGMIIAGVPAFSRFHRI